jgi:hypothetical protein
MAGGPPSFFPDASSGTHQQEVQALRNHNQHILFITPMRTNPKLPSTNILSVQSNPHSEQRRTSHPNSFLLHSPTFSSRQRSWSDWPIAGWSSRSPISTFPSATFSPLYPFNIGPSLTWTLARALSATKSSNRDQWMDILKSCTAKFLSRVDITQRSSSASRAYSEWRCPFSHYPMHSKLFQRFTIMSLPAHRFSRPWGTLFLLRKRGGQSEKWQSVMSFMSSRELCNLFDRLVTQYDNLSENRTKLEGDCAKLREYIDAQVQQMQLLNGIHVTLIPSCNYSFTSYLQGCWLLLGPIKILLFPHFIWCSSHCPRIGSSMLYHCRLYVSHASLMAETASNWAYRYQGHSVMLLWERSGTQFNNCSVPDRSLDFLPLSPPDVFPIDIHSSDTFPFPDPRLESTAWILASELFDLILNHLKHSKISFVHFPGYS